MSVRVPILFVQPPNHFTNMHGTSIDVRAGTVVGIVPVKIIIIIENFLIRI
jgi:hypothetical protein